MLLKSLALAGFASGLTEALIVNPFEVVKVRLQTDKQKFTVVGFSTRILLKLIFSFSNYL